MFKLFTITKEVSDFHHQKKVVSHFLTNYLSLSNPNLGTWPWCSTIKIRSTQQWRRTDPEKYVVDSQQQFIRDTQIDCTSSHQYYIIRVTDRKWSTVIASSLRYFFVLQHPEMTNMVEISKIGKRLHLATASRPKHGDSGLHDLPWRIITVTIFWFLFICYRKIQLLWSIGVQHTVINFKKLFP
jgi:hypothetical protein